MIKNSNESRISFILSGAAFAMIGSTSAIAQSQGVYAESKAVVIDPRRVEPTEYEGTDFRKGGPAVHRRAVTKARDGSRNVDAGYNVYRVGVGDEAPPYAYNKAEYCFISEGALSVTSDGIEVIARAGDFMWRPAFASTDRAVVIEPYEGICIFSPARDVGGKHRVASDQVGTWPSGDPDDKPKVVWMNVRNVPVTPQPGNANFMAGLSTMRKVHKDSRLDVRYYTFEAGTLLASSRNSTEEVCWLALGSARATLDGAEVAFDAKDFLYKPVNASVDKIEFAEHSEMICFADVTE